MKRFFEKICPTRIQETPAASPRPATNVGLQDHGQSRKALLEEFCHSSTPIFKMWGVYNKCFESVPGARKNNGVSQLIY